MTLQAWYAASIILAPTHLVIFIIDFDVVFYVGMQL